MWFKLNSLNFVSVYFALYLLYYCFPITMWFYFRLDIKIREKKYNKNCCLEDKKTNRCTMWTPELEVNLFHALKGHKPTGINRFFHMACIHNKMMNSCEMKDLMPKQIWSHLTAMYNLETLNELDELPFPNDTVDFLLPEEMTNPEFMSAPSSPATSVASAEDVPIRPNNLNLTNLKNSAILSTPENLMSPKRKRNARQAQLSSNSQPSSPATPSTSTKRRR